MKCGCGCAHIFYQIIVESFILSGYFVELSINHLQQSDIKIVNYFSYVLVDLSYCIAPELIQMQTATLFLVKCIADAD